MGSSVMTGRHIVYLDDYPAMVVLAQAMLEPMGYRVSGFGAAADALEFLRVHPRDVDLFVTDHHMPHQSGLELAAEIRRIQPALPVILASGCVTDALREEAARLGVTHLFDKPSGIEALCSLVGSIVPPTH